MSLRPRHIRVLQYVADGHSRKQGPERIGLTYRTIRAYLRQAQQALGANNSTHAVAAALRQGLIE